MSQIDPKRPFVISSQFGSEPTLDKVFRSDWPTLRQDGIFRLADWRWDALAKGKTKGSLRSTDEPEGTTRAGDEARESAERYALVAEAITEGIYDWNMASDTLHLSVRLYAILGLAPGLLRAGDWNEHIHPDDFPAYRAALSRHFKGETERFDCEYRMRRGSGDFIWIADRLDRVAKLLPGLLCFFSRCAQLHFGELARGNVPDRSHHSYCAAVLAAHARSSIGNPDEIA